MNKQYKQNRRGFTIVELVIVIAVIAILAGVLIPTFSGIIDRANRSKAMQEARNAWNEVSYTYAAGYQGFVYSGDELNGWYYDYKDQVAKYTVDDTYTVTYDGESFVVNNIDDSAWVWDEVESASTDFSNYSLGTSPFGLKLCFYSDVYSRGFAWITAPGTTDSKLYVVESNLGKDADFSSATPIDGTSDSSRSKCVTHKAVISNLKANTVYSFKVGSSTGWEYGVFKTEVSNPSTITAIQLSDAQTLDPTKLATWENTLAQAVETAGRSLDMILFNGDQFDSNMTGIGQSIDRNVRYSIAIDTVEDYIDSIPYITVSGNHEPANSETGIHVNNTAVNFAGTSGNGGYYSFNYNFAHFVVLNSNDTTDAQLTWLKSDLQAAQSSKWIIVMMHNGPYATGDHSNNSVSQSIITRFTPIFSQYHVDLVLQAHDHTYNKTLPYKWNAAGYTTTSNNGDVVNLNPTTTTYNGETYDLNPNGTYYVTTGAAGHRVGASEAKDGIWADVNDSTGAGLYSKTFTNNTYKIEVGKITEENKYKAYTYDGATSDQKFNVGDYATGNVNAQMFGVLNLTENTLTYDFYTVEGNDVKLFDTLNVMKTN